jgi:CDP-4-dehydro-6-deoxyglucose reductase, E3
MPVISFGAEVCAFRDLTHDVREITVRLLDPPGITFKAGQFISFEVHQEGKKFPLTRPYSIASPPSRKDTLDLLLNLVPGGPGSSYLFSLQPGDRTQFKGPAGAFYLHEDHGRDHLFVATGTGIAPFRSMLYTLCERPSSSAITLVWGVRHERDLYYQDELQALTRAYPNFRFTMTLSRPGEGWRGETGRVTRYVDQSVESVQNLAVYLCGNSGMLADVTEVVRTKGLCPIYREKFYDDAADEP